MIPTILPIPEDFFKIDEDLNLFPLVAYLVALWGLSFAVAGLYLISK